MALKDFNYNFLSSCPTCQSVLVGIEYAPMTPEHYDGVSEYACIKNCGFRVGRWSGKLLKLGEIEGRYGIGTPVKIDENIHPEGENTDSK